MADQSINVRLRTSYDTEANWAASTKILLTGELAICSETGQYKVGDGAHTWSQLSYPVSDSKGPKVTSVTLTSANWIGEVSPYQYTISEVSCTATQNIEIALANNLTNTQIMDIAKYGITPYSQDVNSIVLQAKNLPIEDISIVVSVGGEPE